jgi:hypothetical protein
MGRAVSPATDDANQEAPPQGASPAEAYGFVGFVLTGKGTKQNIQLFFLSSPSQRNTVRITNSHGQPLTTQTVRYHTTTTERPSGAA